MSYHDDNVRKFGEMIYECGTRGIELREALEEVLDKLKAIEVETKLPFVSETLTTDDWSYLKKRHEAGLAEYRRNRPFGIDSNLLT